GARPAQSQGVCRPAGSRRGAGDRAAPALLADRPADRARRGAGPVPGDEVVSRGFVRVDRRFSAGPRRADRTPLRRVPAQTSSLSLRIAPTPPAPPARSAP